MKSLPRAILASCLGMLVWGSARAAGGQIGFVGAVVVPTCAVASAQLDDARTASMPQACPSAGVASLSPSQIYALSVRAVASDGGGDRLLAYFGHYLAVAERQATLVTQTYE